MVDYVREITGKKSCKYGEYGSFEHVMCLCIIVTTSAINSCKLILKDYTYEHSF